MMDREKVDEFIGFMIVLTVMLTGMFGLPVAAYYILQHQSSAAFELASALAIISVFFWWVVIRAFLEKK